MLDSKVVGLSPYQKGSLCSFMYQHKVGGGRGVRDNRGNLGGGCERREPFAIMPSIMPPPTIEIATLDIVVWR